MTADNCNNYVLLSAAVSAIRGLTFLQAHHQ